MRITIEHAREAGYCIDGMRLFAKQHNLSLRDFIKHGMDEQDMRKLNDCMANKVIEVAHGKK